MSRVRLWSEAPPLGAALILLAVVARIWAGRLLYPFDLEWMEGGMLAHAWRLDQGLPLYVPPNADFVPYVYPPGYAALVALLGEVFGLSMPLGRAVSIVGALAAAVAAGVGVRRAGGSLGLAIGCGAAFLGTYPQAGAFYDLVRPDSLAIGFLGAAIAVGAETDRRAPVAAGALLVLGFLTKQNVAAFGLPMLLGIGLRDPRAGLRFALASVVPALLAVGALQWWSGGEYLVWMLDVPASHPMAWPRWRVEVPREWGTAAPAAFAVLALGLVREAARRQRTVPSWLAAGLPTWLGMVAAWWGTYEVPPEGSGVYPVAYGTAYFGVVAGAVASGVLAVGWVADRLRAGERPSRPDARAAALLYEAGIVAVAGVTTLTMRVHDSGFVNVHAPLFWVLAWALGRALTRWAAEVPASAPVGGAIVGAQLVWSAGLFDAHQLVPDSADTAVGWRFVEEMRKVDGPVLSPFAAWLPVYAGKEPSVHAMGLWDCNVRGGPYFDEVGSFRQALEQRRWALALGGRERVVDDLAKYYEPVRVVVPIDDPRFEPRTGYMARPFRVMAPRPPK